MVHKREREKKEWYSGHDGEFGACNSIYKKNMYPSYKKWMLIHVFMLYPCIRITQLIHDSKKEKKWPTEKFEMEKNSKKVEVNFCVQNYFHARTSLSVMV